MPESQTLQATDTTTPKEKNKGGRPTTFTETLGSFILHELAGGETLKAICKTPGMPVPQTVHRWRKRYPAFDAAYRVAREHQAESWGDDCIEISDDDTLDTYEGPKGTMPNHANVQRDRLRIETRWRLMQATNAATFGKQVDHKHSGTVDHTHRAAKLSDRERMRRLASYMLQDQADGLIIEGEAEPAPEGVNNSPPAADIVSGKTVDR